MAQIMPSSGPTGDHQHTIVTIIGTGFQDKATVKFGDTTAPDSVPPDRANVLLSSKAAAKLSIPICMERQLLL